MRDSWVEKISRGTGSRQESPKKLLEGDLKTMSPEYTFLVEFTESRNRDSKKPRSLSVKYFPSYSTQGKEASEERESGTKEDRRAKTEPIVWRSFEGADDYTLRNVAKAAWKDSLRVGSEKVAKEQ